MGNQIFPDMEEFMQDLFPLCKYKYVWRPLHYSKQLDVASNTTGSAAKWLPLNSAFFKWLNLAVCLFWKKLFYFMLVRGFASSLVPLLVREIRHLRCASFPFCLSAKEGGGFLHFPPFLFFFFLLFFFLCSSISFFCRAFDYCCKSECGKREISAARLVYSRRFEMKNCATLRSGHPICCRSINEIQNEANWCFWQH